jgi:hypothetical protein
MSIDQSVLIASVAVLLLFGSVMVLTGVLLKQRGFIPNVKPDPPGYWQRAVSYAWACVALSIIGITAATWSALT